MLSCVINAPLALPVVPLVMALRDVTVAYTRLHLAAHGGSVSARRSGKIKAVVQGAGAMLLLLMPVLGWPGGKTVVSWIVLGVTAASAVEYVAAAVSRRSLTSDKSDPSDESEMSDTRG